MSTDVKGYLMLRKKVIIDNVYGLHMRPALKIALACLGMESKVLIMNGLKKASCFSILEMLLLEAKFGSEVEIVAEGIDEALAMETVSGFF